MEPRRPPKNPPPTREPFASVADAGYERRDNLENDVARRRLSADVSRVGDGDHAAFRRVYEQTSRKLFGICVRILPDRAAAEDALQDIYVSVWKHAARFDATRASPITWLCTIARNHAIDLRRSAQRRSEHAEKIHPIVAADPPPTADAVLLEAESERDALACLDELKENQRTAIRQAFLEGLTYQELADRSAVPLGTMKSWIRRGLIEMRRCLADG